MSVSTTSHLRLALRSLFLLLISLAAASPVLAATTYYVRTDGGDASQCTGKGDAAYPGSGTGQACAWKNPNYALPPNDAPRIAGGDTLIIGAGSYQIGLGAPGSDVGRCGAGWPYDCYMAKVPSGLSATAKTRILGRGYDTGCAAPPKFWGTDRVTMVVNMQGSSNVELGCIEITDQSDCIEFHADTAIRCQRDTAPYGQWASVGVSAKASSNVWLHDLNIHGLANRGLVAGGLTDWTVERVKIKANGWAGWDGDIGTGSSNSGAIVLRQVEIAWNGCGERWQTGVIHGCWGQQSGGYGDGLGTATTGGQWLIEDSFFHHNTSDGLDLLYMDGASTSSVTIRRVYAAGNAGNQLKTKGQTLIENSVVVGNCAYFNGQYNMTDMDQCRALGNAISIGLIGGQTTTVRNNTVIGEGDCLILSENGDSASQLIIQNNALVGQIDWRGNKQGNPGELACGHYSYNSPNPTVYAGNLFYNVKQAQCPAGSICGQDPKFKNMTMAAFDAEPLAGSPVIDKGIAIAALTTDFLLQPRPSGAAMDIGAIELQGAGTGPTCTRAAPTVSMTGPTAVQAPGAVVNFTITIVNRDSAACSGTVFTVARSVPTGWTGTLDKAGVTIAPGASTTATLSVTSPSSATAGTYGIGAGVSSSVGAAHTASASATYQVDVSSITETVSTNKSAYVGNETVTLTARVLKNAVVASGATISFRVVAPNGRVTVLAGTTDASGNATATMVLPRRKESIGGYNVRATATLGGLQTTATAKFRVN
jgi:NPCBM-associated, NEW3 domain of alpha-galactosidase